jgi:hypothetical protein
MDTSRGNRQLLSWVIGASLSLVPALVAAPSAQGQQEQAQQDQTQQNQTQTQQNQPQPGQPGNWGQAGPPPDATNGQIPSPAANGQPSDDGGPPPPPDADNGPVAPAYGQPGRPAYQPNPNQPRAYAGQAQAPRPVGPVTVPAGTLLQIRTTEPLDTKKVQPGDYFQGTIARSVYQGNVLAIPRGADVVGRVTDVKKPGDLKGSAGFTLQLTSLNMSGQSYPIVSDTWSFDGPGKGAYTAGNTVGGAALGAVIGAIAGGGPGAAVGAVAGTGVGLGASAATSGPRGMIPPESVLTFHLTQPATVQPVSYQEARDLEQNSAPPRPGPYPSGYAPGYGPYPPPAPYYGYPAPYAYAYPYPYVYAYGYPYPYRYYRYR